MRNYLFLGDTHGDLDFVESAIALARREKAEIVQCGDWGFVWPGTKRLKKLSGLLASQDVTMRFVDGNHDDHPRLRKHIRACEATTIAPGVIYQPRGSVHEDEDGTRFLFCGGAPSIDRRSRVEEGQSWWPEETITGAELERALSARGPIHVLVTHDAPAFPPGFSSKGSPDHQRAQLLSLERVDALVRRHRPGLHVHGHWHCRYDRVHASHTLVTGLDCNQLDPASLDDSTLLWSRGT